MTIIEVLVKRERINTTCIGQFKTNYHLNRDFSILSLKIPVGVKLDALQTRPLESAFTPYSNPILMKGVFQKHLVSPLNPLNHGLGAPK